MNPRIAANQQRTFLVLLGQVLPHVATDSALPRRIKELLGRNRALGSRDRRLYRELIYTALRFLPWIEPLLKHDPEKAAALIAWLAPDLKDTAGYRSAQVGDWPAVPTSLSGKADLLRTRYADAGPFEPTALLPAWFREHCPAAFSSPHLDALLARAPLWVRLQVQDRRLVLDELQRLGWPARASAALTDAFALPPNAEVASTDAYRRGFVEIQDLGSQLVLAHAPVAAGQHWLDACAGAGGKTVQLARLVTDAGRVDATDVRPAVLEELRERAARARLTNIRLLAPPQVGDTRYDGIVVDAPCSGTGTWRRLPHMKWYTRPEMIPRFAADQLGLLAQNRARLKPNGLLVYATCSLSRMENQEVVARFLESHPAFAAEKPARDFGGLFDGVGTTLLPAVHDSDGFYVALLRRRG